MCATFFALKKMCKKILRQKSLIEGEFSAKKRKINIFLNFYKFFTLGFAREFLSNFLFVEQKIKRLNKKKRVKKNVKKPFV